MPVRTFKHKVGRDRAVYRARARGLRARKLKSKGGRYRAFIEG